MLRHAIFFIVWKYCSCVHSGAIYQFWERIDKGRMGGKERERKREREKEKEREGDLCYVTR